MTDAGDKTYSFTCPECFVSLKARPIQAGARQMCPSCSASIVVPPPPAAKSIAGQTDLTIDTSAIEASPGYDLHTPTPTPIRSVSEDSNRPTPTPTRSASEDRGRLTSTPPRDLIAVTCHICKTRAYTDRKNLGKKLRCSECGTVVPIVEAAKTQAEMHRPRHIDDLEVGEYGVRTSDGAPLAPEEVTIPFKCRLCDTLLRGTLAQIGTQVVCPDCGTKTVVPPPKRVAPKAVIGSAATGDLEEYGMQQPNVAATSLVPVVCSLCHSRLMARADQVGQKIMCPDCGRETVVPQPALGKTGAVIGVMSRHVQSAADTYGVNLPPATAGSPAAANAAATSAPGAQRRTVVHIGVNCPVCGTRIHATDQQVGQKVPCPDCDAPITIPPPKADAQVEETIIGGSEEYGVSAPQQTVSLTIKTSRALPKTPEDDPDFDFLDEVDDPELRWRLKDRSDELGFLGHPGASNRWFSYSLSGAGVFAIFAVALTLFGASSGDAASTAVTWFGACVLLGASGLACLLWAALLSVNLVAIVQDTSAGNHVIRNWPEGAWTEQIGEAFYVINSCLVSFIPVTILVQTCPPVRPLGMYIYAVGFWLTFPIALFSTLETGSVMTPVSRPVFSSLVRRIGAWGWFYFRSFGVLALGIAMYLAFWRHICGPFAMPLLVAMAVALAMVYARWLGILGVSIREMMEEDTETDDEEE